MFGVIIRMNKPGQIDLEDEEIEGVEEEEEVDSGGDELRDGQITAKFNAMTKGLDEQLNAAIHVALETAQANSHLLSSVVNCELDLRCEFCSLRLSAMTRLF